MNYDLIEQLLNLPRVKVKRIEQKEDKILIWLYVPDGQHVCPKCGMIHTKVSEITEMKVRDLSIFAKPVTLLCLCVMLMVLFHILSIDTQIQLLKV